jgi:hypothetical protein
MLAPQLYEIGPFPMQDHDEGNRLRMYGSVRATDCRCSGGLRRQAVGPTQEGQPQPPAPFDMGNICG